MKNDYLIWKSTPRLPRPLRLQLRSMSEQQIDECFGTNIDFGTGGMRGIMGAGTNRINDLTIKQATMGLAHFLLENHHHPTKVVIAFDTRDNSKHFAMICAQTLAYYGIQTLIFKVPRPTPELSFSVRHLHADAGIVITASHNPPNYNGFKIYDENGCQFVPHKADKVRQKMIAYGDYFEFKTAAYKEYKTQGLIAEIGLDEDEAYLDMLLKLSAHYEEPKKLKIVYTPLHGTGIAFGAKLLCRLGYRVTTVKEQSVVDHQFSTLGSPNPENTSSFILAERLGKQLNFDILFATDPDADRLGVAYKDGEKYSYLTGATLGVLMLDYLLKSRPIDKKAKRVLITTIVTPPLGSIMAINQGLEVIHTLTGFKFIGEQIELLDDKKRFFFGYEESNGYLISPEVRDKDAFQAMVICAEMFNNYLNEGVSISMVLEDIYRRYGYFADDLLTYQMNGLQGIAEIDRIMDIVRASGHHLFHSFDIKTIEDYQSSLGYDLDSKKQYAISLPQSNVIRLTFKQGTIVFRPSGTEPKLKIYLSLRGSTLEVATKLKEEAIKIIDDMLKKQHYE